jgi:hypothetical protein
MDWVLGIVSQGTHHVVFSEVRSATASSIREWIRAHPRSQCCELLPPAPAENDSEPGGTIIQEFYSERQVGRFSVSRPRGSLQSPCRSPPVSPNRFQTVCLAGNHASAFFHSPGLVTWNDRAFRYVQGIDSQLPICIRLERALPDEHVSFTLLDWNSTRSVGDGRCEVSLHTIVGPPTSRECTLSNKLGANPKAPPGSSSPERA